ncbi:MAG: sensor histidine kinase [Candidatus Dormibacteria bacterium]
MDSSDWSASVSLLEGIADLLEGPEEGLVLVDLTGVVRYASALARRDLDLLDTAVGRHLVDSNPDFHLVRLVAEASAGDLRVERRWTMGDRELSVRARRIHRPAPGVLLWVRDETRERRLEKMRRDFISNVSHELRTPLTAMRVMAETLLAGALNDDDAAADFVRRIALEVEQMAQMVEELLELSALEDDARATPQRRVPVSSLLVAVERLRPLVDDKRIALVFDVSDGVAPIRGDAAQLQHLVRNLVHNAVKFTPAEGRVTVSASHADGAVVLRVSDTGSGIRSDDLPRIFERFWKADGSRRRDGEGSGLGLAIVRHVVAAHGGSIDVESELGVGTTFTVTLPAWSDDLDVPLDAPAGSGTASAPGVSDVSAPGGPGR